MAIGLMLWLGWSVGRMVILLRSQVSIMADPLSLARTMSVNEIKYVF